MNFDNSLSNANITVEKIINNISIVLTAHVLSPRGLRNELQQNCSETEHFTSHEFNEIYRGIVDAGFFVKKVFFSEYDFIVDITSKLNEYSDTIVFNLCRNGTKMNKKAVVPAICDLLGVTFTCSSAGICALARNKRFFTSLLSSSGIKCPITGICTNDLTSRLNHNNKIICKPIDGSASQGISEKSITKLSDIIIQNDNNTFLQEYIDGYECEVPVFTSQGKCFALPPVGISFRNESTIGILTYESSKDNKYGFYNLFDCLPKLVCSKIMRDAEKSFELLGLEIYGRIDFRIDRSTHNHYVIDVSTTPYITRHSSFNFAVNNIGGKYSDIFLLIIAAALQG